MSFVLDFETRSAVDLKKAGAYRYAEDPSTVVLMLGYARPGEEPDWWQPGEPFPGVLVEAARSATEPLHAHNALFERLIWNGPLRRVVPGLPILPASAWDCTMARGAAAGWPLKLERLGEAMDLHQQKDPRGSQLVAAWGNAKRNPRAETFPDLVEYCRQDVRAESAALLRLPALSKRERQVWLLDQTINDRGVGVDVESARAIKALLADAVRDISASLHRLTGGAVDRPTQAARIRDWANERLLDRGLRLHDLKAETVEHALNVWDWTHLDPAVREVLSARQEAGGAAVKKIDAMLACVCSDGRARGLLQYHAANTGRWGGRLIQPQNFPRPTQKIDPAIFRAVRDDPRRVREMVETFFGGVFTAAADALRPLLWSPPGSGKIIRRADLNAIEARIVLWLAGHEDAMAIFRSGHCIYCEQASAVYGRRIVKGEHPNERQVGKVIVLGCGYQMGASRFQEHAAANGIIVTLAQAEEYVRAYRTRWHGVPKLWYGLERAAWAAVLKGGTHSHAGCDFAMHEGALCCRIPSGRVLRWQGVEVDQGVDDDRPTLYVRKIEAGRWKRLSLYGGLITERVTQALARDVMVHGMMLAEEAGLPAILTVHDEVVTEPLVDGPSVRVLEECMTTVPRWAPGLPLAAEGAEGPRYGK